MNSIVCTVCKEAGHRLDRCPELAAPLRPGFMAPSGGGGHSHDDDDEKLKNVVAMGQANYNGVYWISSPLRGSLPSFQASTSPQRL